MKRRNRNFIISLLVGAVFIGGLVFYQKWAIAKEVNLQKVVYAQKSIPPRTEITEDLVMVREISGSAIPPNAVLDPQSIIGKYTGEFYTIEENELLLMEKFIDYDELPDIGVLSLEEGEEAFPLLVDLESSLGNSIMPNAYVDLYFKGVETYREDGINKEKPIFGKVASHVRVTSAKDTQASNVFEKKQRESKQTNDPILGQVEKSQEARSLAKIYTFAVSPEQNKLLNKGKMVGQIIPVISGEAYNNDLIISNDEVDEKLIDFIENEATIEEEKDENKE